VDGDTRIKGDLTVDKNTNVNFGGNRLRNLASDK
jgi:hypothetical protein